MRIDTSALCDIYSDQVDVVEPIFSSFGGASSFYGKITTVKCFESNGLIASVLEEEGQGRVLLIDGGGAVQAVNQRFHGADEPRGQYEIPIAVVVLRAVKSVQVIPEPGGKLRDELARLPGGRFQPFGIGQRFRRHVETGFFG